MHEPPSADELRPHRTGPAAPAGDAGDGDADSERRLVRPRRAIDLACRAAAEVLERVSDAFLAFDGSDHVVYVNRRAAALIGTPTEALVGRPLGEALPAPVVRALAAMGSGRALAGGPSAAAVAGLPEAAAEAVSVEHAPPHEVDVYLEPHGRWVALRAFPFDDGWAVYLRDVTPRKRAEAEREALLEREQAARHAAEAAGRAQSEFLATMSHELRTPINAFKGYVQLLELELAGPVTPQQRDYLARLATSSDHLLTLVNDVLDVAKADAGRLVVAREVADAAEAVDAALALTLPLLDEKALHLHQRCVPPAAVASSVASSVAPSVASTAPATVAYVGDPDRVRQILVNLLSNAAKFTPTAGTITVACATVAEAPPEARVRGAGPWTLLTVQDTGVGIPPEEQAAVFEAFHQVESGHTRAQGGTGLGLAISRRLARLMDGDLTLRSAVGKGSCFTLWLPAPGAADAGAAPTRDGAEARAARDGEAAASPSALAVPLGLAEIGQALRAEIDTVLATLTERLRADPETPVARAMRQPALEDHAITLLGDMAQSLVIIADAGAQAAELLRDGSEIERIVADRHGLRRHAQGWTVAAVRREYAILSEVVERAVRARVAGAGEAGARRADEALGVLAGLLRHAMAISVRAWERTERARLDA